MTVERRKFQILKIQDGGRICTETLRTQMLQTIAVDRVYLLDHRDDTLVIFAGV